MVCRFEDDAGVGDKDARDGIERADFVEVCEGENELVVYGV